MVGANMAPNPVSSADHSAQDLQHFLAWVTPLAFGFAALFGVICLISGNSWVSVLALSTFADACVLLLARTWVRRNATQQAAALICISLLATNLLAAAIEPISAPTLVIVPLL